jgi:hypothetical protein
MQLRLGEYQCQSCPHSMPAAAPEEPRRSSQGYSSGSSHGGSSTYGGGPNYGHSGGAPKPQAANPQWDPGAQYRQAAPPPPVPGAPGSMLGNYDTGATFNEGSARDSLHIEKIIFLVVSGLISIVAGYLQVSAGLPGTEPLSMLGPAAIIGSLFFGALVYCGIVSLALFVGSAGIKWTCLGCNGCGVISALIALLGGGAMMAEMGGSNPVSTALNLGLMGWLIWLLWRDIQQT